MLYFDTSAILPYYRRERATERVQSMLSRQSEPVLVSQLTEVEVASALARWVRTGELTDPHANRIESAFLDDLGVGRFQRCSLEAKHYQRANHWISTRKTALRTLDSLHLACAEQRGATLITEDQALINAAEFFGIPVQRAG